VDLSGKAAHIRTSAGVTNPIALCSRTVCSASEIEKEAWEQIQVHVNVAGTEVLQDQNLSQWFLDPDVQFPNPTAVTNLEPLMINTSGSLQYRPEASTEMPNLFLASDYVRTYTAVACMEAANEAAGRWQLECWPPSTEKQAADFETTMSKKDPEGWAEHRNREKRNVESVR